MNENIHENMKKIKEDINFIEYPNWVIDKNNKLSVLTIEKSNGRYEVISPLGLPKHFDKIIYYFLLHKLYREKKFNTYTLKTSRYEIAKDIFGGTHFGKNIFERILKSIKKWQSISINFDGIFYEKDGYTTRGFSIIDEYCLRKKSGELTLRFNEVYIKQLKESKFYKLIDFEEYKKLHKTTSARLYEILIKNFKERSEWTINLQLLAEKITFEKRPGAKEYYASDILRRLKPGIDEINKKTNLCIEFHYNRETSTCIFKKIENPQNIFIPAKKIRGIKQQQEKALVQQIDECMEQFKMLSVDAQKKIRDEIKKQQFYKFMPNEKARIFTYMNLKKQKENVKFE